MKVLIILLVALICCSLGFKKYVWFISIGYGFAIAGIGLTYLIMFMKSLTPVTLIMLILLIVYGIRLGGYLLLRELKSKAYQNTMKTEIKDGKEMSLFVKTMLWLTVAVLYFLEACPVYFRLVNQSGSDLCGYIGMFIMLGGICLESFADYTKNNYKKDHPHRFCDVSVFQFVRCPNYLGEVLIWTGVFVSGFTVYNGLLQFVLAFLGWISIVYIMFGGARRLELRQNKNYGDDPEYQKYVKEVPILLPFVPLYSVAKYKWLVG